MRILLPALLAAVTAFAAPAASDFAQGAVKAKSFSKLAFSPTGILFVGDSIEDVRHNTVAVTLHRIQKIQTEVENANAEVPFRDSYCSIKFAQKVDDSVWIVSFE